jgi:hypothetical protein
MVRNRAHKQDVRASQGTNSYTRTARLAGAAPTSIIGGYSRQLEAFADAGWPVVAQIQADKSGAWIAYVGPACLAVVPHDSARNKADVGFDLTGREVQHAPYTVEVSAPAAVTSDPVVSFEVPGDWSPARIVEAVALHLAEARVQALTASVADAACGLCGDAHSAAHLLSPTVEGSVVVCPACVFDGDLLPAALPQRLALSLDEMFISDLAMPAGWAAVTALLACAAGPGVETRLSESRIGWPWEPLEYWDNPESIWIWLPPTDRPAALTSLGPGASLLAITAAVEAAHPHLQADVRRRLEEQMEDDEDVTRPAEFPLEQLWPAIVASAVAFGTDAIERNDQRPPIVNVSDYFEVGVLAEHFTQLDSALDPYEAGVVVTLEAGIRAIVEALGWIWSGPLDLV